ncbi:MAG: hypothetical protein RLZZ416_310 [Candidatus Parcubacteria bacterium]|jgi:riboflavin kinase/FMN adenylyltransferase
MRFSGVVKKGAGRGKELGYPTINIVLKDSAVSGIYAALVKVGDEKYPAAAYADPKREILEAHILDFDEDLYGWNVAIELLEKQRESKRFSDDAALRRQIAADIAAVRAYFEKAR